MPAPVTDSKLSSAIKGHLTETHAMGIGALNPVVGAFIKAILPGLIAFLQSRYDITPKASS